MADTTRMKALKNLQQSMPAGNEQVAKGLQAARGMQLQQAVAGAPVGAGAPAAQQLGAQTAAAAGQAQLAQAQQAQQQTQQVAQMGLQEQGLQQREELAGLERGLQEQNRESRDRIAGLGEDVKNQILDSRIEFQRDENGRTYLNERKLADYMRLKAEDDDQFEDWKQQSMQMHERKMKFLEIGHRKIEQALQHELSKSKQEKNQETIKTLQKMKQDWERKQREAETESKNKSAMWGSIGSLAGGAAAAYASGGDAQATKAGAQAGGGLGKSLSGA